MRKEELKMKGVSFDFVNSATPFSLNFRKYLPANIMSLTKLATNYRIARSVGLMRC